MIKADGTAGSFKGFDGTANKNVEAPYIVATGHKKADWEEYNKKQEAAEEEKQPEETVDKSEQAG